MTKDPRSPFNWRMHTEPSIFATDPAFKARKDGKTDSERASEITEARRSSSKDPVDLYALGAAARNRRDRSLLAYKQFGATGKSGAPKKLNKHEK